MRDFGTFFCEVAEMAETEAFSLGDRSTDSPDVQQAEESSMASLFPWHLRLMLLAGRGHPEASPRFAE